MFVYEKRLQYPIKIKNTNPKLAARSYAIAPSAARSSVRSAIRSPLQAMLAAL